MVSFVWYTVLLALYTVGSLRLYCSAEMPHVQRRLA